VSPAGRHLSILQRTLRVLLVRWTPDGVVAISRGLSAAMPPVTWFAIVELIPLVRIAVKSLQGGFPLPGVGIAGPDRFYPDKALDEQAVGDLKAGPVLLRPLALDLFPEQRPLRQDRP